MKTVIDRPLVAFCRTPRSPLWHALVKWGKAFQIRCDASLKSIMSDLVPSGTADRPPERACPKCWPRARHGERSEK